MSVTVRTAGPSDAPEIAKLTVQLGYDVGEEAVADRLGRILTRDDQRIIVAERDGRVLGWIHVGVAEFLESPPFVVIAGLVIAKDHRRRGLGTLLLQHAEDWARATGCTIVRLWSSDGRTGAHEFYKRLGYAHIKTQYSFVKTLDAREQHTVARLVPSIEE